MNALLACCPSLQSSDLCDDLSMLLDEVPLVRLGGVSPGTLRCVEGVAGVLHSLAEPAPGKRSLSGSRLQANCLPVR